MEEQFEVTIIAKDEQGKTSKVKTKLFKSYLEEIVKLARGWNINSK
jgi:hypothetical protein